MVLETKPDATNAIVLSNGTGVGFHPDTRLEVNRFLHEPFSPNHTDLEIEPSVSQTSANLSRGSIGLCPNKLVAGSSMIYSTRHANVAIRGRKVVIETTNNETIISLIEGDVTVRGEIMAGGQTLKPGQQAVLTRPSNFEPPVIVVRPIPEADVKRLESKVAIACMARRTVYFEVGERQNEATRRSFWPGHRPGSGSPRHADAEHDHQPLQNPLNRFDRPRGPTTIMGLRTFRHWALHSLFLAHLSCLSSFALLRFNEGRDQIFVNVSLSVGFDSNIFANSSNESDLVTNSTVGLEYARRAGMISVNGHADWNLGSFASNSDSDFANPSLGVEFVKNSGRTTGAITLSVSQESQADPNVGLRTDSWNYNAGLNWKYPVIERYSLAGSFGYGLVDYTDNSAGLVDLNTYTASLDLFYTYTASRDLIFGYRIRESGISSGGGSTDHSFTAGVSVKILAKLNDTVRAAGFTDTAKGTAVNVTRVTPEGKKQVFTIDVDSLLKGKSGANINDNSLMLEPGDIVLVPERLI